MSDELKTRRHASNARVHSVVAEGNGLCVTRTFTVDRFSQLRWARLLDHARLSKTDVHYDSGQGRLVVHLRRHGPLCLWVGRFAWLNIFAPRKKCTLTIMDIETCDIRDEDPKNPRRKEVIIGGLRHVGTNQFYIGSFCDHENPYGIDIRVRRVNMSLTEGI